MVDLPLLSKFLNLCARLRELSLALFCKAWHITCNKGLLTFTSNLYESVVQQNKFMKTETKAAESASPTHRRVMCSLAACMQHLVMEP